MKKIPITTRFPKRFMQIAAAIIAVLFISPNPWASANDAVLGVTPEGVYPITQSDIAMEAEEIIIKMVGYSEAEVSCRFDFKNYGDAQTVLVGFPARLGREPGELSTEEDISVREFTARDDKGEIPVNLIDTISNPPLNAYNGMEKYGKWYSFSVDFEKNSEKTLLHTYKVSFAHNSIGDIFAGYVLETGALWRGTIGHSKVVFDLGEHPLYSVTEVYPNNFFRADGNKLVFERRNYKPSFNLAVTINGYHYSKDWIEMLKESGSAGEIEEIDKRIAFFSASFKEVRKNSGSSLKQYAQLIKEDPVKALYIKSALGLPDGSEKPQIADCAVTQEVPGNWRFEVRGTDPNMDIVSCRAEITGLEDYQYSSDAYAHGTVFYDSQEKLFRGRGYLTTNEEKPFGVTFAMMDAAGNIDTQTLILNAEASGQQTSLSPAPSGEENNGGNSDTGRIPENQTTEGAEMNTPSTGGRLIHTEEETVSLLILGVVIVLSVFLLIVLFLLTIKRNPAYLLFIGQIACLAFGLYQVVGLLTRMDEGGAMASENTSLSIGITAVAWAVSMAFMIAGILLSGKNQRNSDFYVYKRRRNRW